MAIPTEYADIAENGLGKADALLLRFEEQTSLVPPSDATTNYLDFTAPTGSTQPTPTALGTAKGIGLAFTWDTAIAAVPAAAPAAGYAGADVGIAVLLSWDLAAQAGSGDNATIVCQGGRADAIGWRLALEVVDGPGRIGRVRLVWQTAAGVDVTPIGAEFKVPEGPFTICASREYTVTGWVVRYAIGEQDAGSATIALGTVAAVAASAVHVGARPVGVGTVYDQHFRGVLEALHVVRRPIVAEEAQIEAWRLMRGGAMVWQALRELEPQGTWPRSSEAYVQKVFFQPDGAALAHLRARARRMRAGFFPDHAWGAALRAWEHWTRVPVALDAGIAERRAAIIEHLTASRAGSAANLKTRSAKVLGLPAASVVVTNPNSEWTDTFDPPVLSGSYITSGHNVRAWISTAGTGGGVITEPAGGNDFLQFTTGGAYAGRYDGSIDSNGLGDPIRYVRYVGGRGRRLRLKVQMRLFTAGNGVLAGFMVGSRRTDEWGWIGLHKVAGVLNYGAVAYVGGIIDPLITTLSGGSAIPGAGPWWLELEHIGNVNQEGEDVAMGQCRIRVAASEVGLASATFTSLAFWFPPELDWAGLSLVLPGGTASLAGAVDVRFSDWWQRSPHGPRPHSSHLFRDPALGGTYDLPGAASLLARITPAHERWTAVDHRKGLYTDDATTLLDRDLVGT